MNKGASRLPATTHVTLTKPILGQWDALKAHRWPRGLRTYTGSNHQKMKLRALSSIIALAPCCLFRGPWAMVALIFQGKHWRNKIQRRVCTNDWQEGNSKGNNSLGRETLPREFGERTECFATQLCKSWQRENRRKPNVDTDEHPSLWLRCPSQ